MVIYQPDKAFSHYQLAGSLDTISHAVQERFIRVDIGVVYYPQLRANSDTSAGKFSRIVVK